MSTAERPDPRSLRRWLALLSLVAVSGCARPSPWSESTLPSTTDAPTELYVKLGPKADAATIRAACERVEPSCTLRLVSEPDRVYLSSELDADTVAPALLGSKGVAGVRRARSMHPARAVRFVFEGGVDYVQGHALVFLPESRSLEGLLARCEALGCELLRSTRVEARLPGNASGWLHLLSLDTARVQSRDFVERVNGEWGLGRIAHLHRVDRREDPRSWGPEEPVDHRGERGYPTTEVLLRLADDRSVADIQRRCLARIANECHLTEEAGEAERVYGLSHIDLEFRQALLRSGIAVWMRPGTAEQDPIWRHRPVVQVRSGHEVYYVEGQLLLKPDPEGPDAERFVEQYRRYGAELLSADIDRGWALIHFDEERVHTEDFFKEARSDPAWEARVKLVIIERLEVEARTPPE